MSTDYQKQKAREKSRKYYHRRKEAKQIDLGKVRAAAQARKLKPDHAVAATLNKTEICSSFGITNAGWQKMCNEGKVPQPTHPVYHHNAEVYLLTEAIAMAEILNAHYASGASYISQDDEETIKLLHNTTQIR